MNLIKSIPSVLTSANLICGFLVFLIVPKYGIWLILLGALFDVFDGAVARWLKAQSEFGKQLDSLADLVTFGAAPAFLISTLLPTPWHFVSCLIIVASALRLAKFNISGGDNYYFMGMPTPASAMFFVGILLAKDWFFGERALYILPLILLIVILNVSNLKMFSFKGLGKDKLTLPFLIITGLAGITMVFIDWRLSILVALLIYILLSIVYTIILTKEK